MSIPQKDEINLRGTVQETNRPTVLVRAFGGEPVALVAVGRLGRAIEVTGSRRSSTIGFPADDVLQFDESLQARLRSAFDADDHDRLRRLWCEAKLYAPN